MSIAPPSATVSWSTVPTFLRYEVNHNDAPPPIVAGAGGATAAAAAGAGAALPQEWNAVVFAGSPVVMHPQQAHQHHVAPATTTILAPAYARSTASRRAHVALSAYSGSDSEAASSYLHDRSGFSRRGGSSRSSDESQRRRRPRSRDELRELGRPGSRRRRRYLNSVLSDYDSTDAEIDVDLIRLEQDPAVVRFEWRSRFVQAGSEFFPAHADSAPYVDPATVDSLLIAGELAAAGAGADHHRARDPRGREHRRVQQRAQQRLERHLSHEQRVQRKLAWLADQRRAERSARRHRARQEVAGRVTSASSAVAAHAARDEDAIDVDDGEGDDGDANRGAAAVPVPIVTNRLAAMSLVDAPMSSMSSTASSSASSSAMSSLDRALASRIASVALEDTQENDDKDEQVDEDEGGDDEDDENNDERDDDEQDDDDEDVDEARDDATAPSTTPSVTETADRVQLDQRHLARHLWLLIHKSSRALMRKMHDAAFLLELESVLAHFKHGRAHARDLHALSDARHAMDRRRHVSHVAPLDVPTAHSPYLTERSQLTFHHFSASAASTSSTSSLVLHFTDRFLCRLATGVLAFHQLRHDAAYTARHPRALCISLPSMRKEDVHHASLLRYLQTDVLSE